MGLVYVPELLARPRKAAHPVLKPFDTAFAHHHEGLLRCSRKIQKVAYQHNQHNKKPHWKHNSDFPSKVQRPFQSAAVPALKNSVEFSSPFAAMFPFFERIAYK